MKMQASIMPTCCRDVVSNHLPKLLVTRGVLISYNTSVKQVESQHKQLSSAQVGRLEHCNLVGLLAWCMGSMGQMMVKPQARPSRLRISRLTIDPDEPMALSHPDPLNTYIVCGIDAAWSPIDIDIGDHHGDVLMEPVMDAFEGVESPEAHEEKKPGGGGDAPISDQSAADFLSDAFSEFLGPGKQSKIGRKRRMPASAQNRARPPSQALHGVCDDDLIRAVIEGAFEADDVEALNVLGQAMQHLYCRCPVALLSRRF